MKLLLANRALRDIKHEEERLSLTDVIQRANKGWHGLQLNQPDWSENSQSFAFQAENRAQNLMFYLLVNGYFESLEFGLPPIAEGKCWRRWIDTSLPSPDDISEFNSATPIVGTTYYASSRSVVILLADLTSQ